MVGSLLRVICCTDAHNEELRRGSHDFDLGISAVRLLPEDKKECKHPKDEEIIKQHVTGGHVKLH